MLRISVIIPAYNAEDTIEKCLNAISHQTFPRKDYEIVVVDDGSLDNTKDIIGKFPDIFYIWQSNKGPSAARNAGAQKARGEIIVYTDSDCIAKPDWLEKMIKPFDDPEVIGAKGTYLTQQKELLARFAQKEFEERYRVLAQHKYIDFVDSYSAAFRKKEFLDVGGFDTQFSVANNEDVELSYKLAAKGYKMVFVPDAVVYHTHSSDLFAYLRVKFSRAYWRMLVYKRFPNKAMRDTYTPLTLKIEFFLTLFIFVSFLGMVGKSIAISYPHKHWAQVILDMYFGTATLIFLGLLFLCTLPLSLRIMKEDFPVGVVAPFILIGRSIVFVLGTIAGIIAFFTQSLRDSAYPLAKRILDVTISFITLLILCPFFVILAMIIRLDSPGPIIFRHTRIGKDGRPFIFYKFRTMVKDAEYKKEELRKMSSLKGPIFKIKEDPRITKAGKFLRRFSLDELPQLFNVLNGTMSLVGPRPLPVIDIEHPELLNPKSSDIDRSRLETWLIARQTVPPGITGLWQIRGRSNLPLEAWFNYDLEYLKRRSLWMDLKIMLRTIPVIVIGKGAQ